MDIIRIIAGPLIGAVIGYFTNYIAVKMLFVPKTEKRIFGIRIPFTPGAIPKGKPRLAKAVGKTVSGALLNKENIEERLLTGELEEKLSDAVVSGISGNVKETLIRVTGCGEEKYEQKADELGALISREIMKTVRQTDIRGIVMSKGKEIIREKLGTGMFSKLLTDSKIDSILEPAAGKIAEVINESGEEHIRPAVDKKLDEIGSRTFSELLSGAGIDEETVRKTVTEVYRKSVREYTGRLLEGLDVASVAESKINGMNPDELEELALSVMKKELSAIVNLGALIGFLLGIINIFL